MRCNDRIFGSLIRIKVRLLLRHTHLSGVQSPTRNSYLSHSQTFMQYYPCVIIVREFTYTLKQSQLKVFKTPWPQFCVFRHFRHHSRGDPPRLVPGDSQIDAPHFFFRKYANVCPSNAVASLYEQGFEIQTRPISQWRGHAWTSIGSTFPSGA